MAQPTENAENERRPGRSGTRANRRLDGSAETPQSLRDRLLVTLRAEVDLQLERIAAAPSEQIKFSEHAQALGLLRALTLVEVAFAFDAAVKRMEDMR